jgi:hypothetical protein
MIAKSKFAGFLVFFALCLKSHATELKLLTNHLGYEATGPKHAVLLGKAGDKVSDCFVRADGTDKVILSLSAKAAGPVKKWKDWYFWTVDFDKLNTEGKYYLECASGQGTIRSFPFLVQQDLLERNTLSKVIYYLKGQRNSGEMEKADSHLLFDGQKKGTLDAHGGWYDATGDYGKHLSHLSFSTYFNPQQIPFVVYSLLKSDELLHRRGLQGFTQYERRLIDEAMFGADYLVRVQDPSGSFYRSVSAPGVKQLAQDRKVAGEMKRFGIFQTATQEPKDMVQQANNDREYEVSYRSGGGVAIAALALASTSPISGEFKSSDYLRAAEDAYEYLETNNILMVNDGKENIVDDYCALVAATELFKATHKAQYKTAADRRAQNLMRRLTGSAEHENYWRADDRDRPYFHAVDAGLPVVSLLYYLEIADERDKRQVLDTARKSLQFELQVTNEVNNPFGYARQLVQDKAGARRTSFFFPHNSDAAPWWQGENARLASLAAASRLAEKYFPQDRAFQNHLETYATNQINWILGLNPFDTCMMAGVGRNNPTYFFFDSWEFTNAPGGISNGITSGFHDEEDIDYDLKWHETGADNDWRWQEQWLPHAAWYLLAASARPGTSP